MTVPTKSPFKAAIGSPVLTVTSANYTITDVDGYRVILVSTGGSTRTITLPAVATNASRVISIKKIDSGTGLVTIAPNGGTIDGSATKDILFENGMFDLISDGTNWRVLASGSLPLSDVTIKSPTPTGFPVTLVTSNGYAGAIKSAKSAGYVSSLTVGGFYPGSYHVNVAIQQSSNRNSYYASFSTFNGYEDTQISNLAAMAGGFWSGGAVTFSLPGSTGNLVITIASGTFGISVVAIGATP